MKVVQFDSKLTKKTYYHVIKTKKRTDKYNHTIQSTNEKIYTDDDLPSKIKEFMQTHKCTRVSDECIKYE